MSQPTHSIPVLNTSICGDQMEEGGSDGPELRGFRKRWARSGEDSCGSSQVGIASLGDELRDGCNSQVGMNEQLLPVMDLNVEDIACDDQPEPIGNLLDSKRRKMHDFERDAVKTTNLQVFKYPWERGRLKKFFSNEPLVTVRSPSLKPGGRNFVGLELQVDATGHVSAKASVEPVTQTSSIFASVVKKLDDVPVREDRDAQRKRAIEGWWNLLAFSLVSSTVGLKVSVEATIDTVVECAHQILDAVFAVKSPGTLMRRLYSIQAYEQWVVDKFGEHWLPITEFRAWQYVSWLKQSEAAPTKSGSFLEALRFFWYLLGVEGAGEAEGSLRIKGISSQMRAAKKPWRPADLLKLEEVIKLHSILADSSQSLGDRVFAGHMLHMLYGRARWSDLTCVTDLFMDPDCQYVECSTRHHKGGRSAEMKSKLLPIAAPSKGVDHNNWGVQYMQVRKLAGLELVAGQHGPMLPAPLNEQASVWSARALTSEEGSAFLRKILGAPKTVTRRISTHSMKSTVLSWASKYGICDSNRAVLARHVSSVASATAVYSRDLLSPVLREMDAMLTAIRTGMFNPDRTRSGMLTPVGMAQGAPLTPFGRGIPPMPSTPKPFQALEAQPEIPQEIRSPISFAGEEEPLWKGSPVAAFEEASPAEVGLADSDTTEENSTQSSSESGSEAEQQEAPALMLDQPSDFYINNKSLVVHCRRNAGVLKCGRRVTPNFSKVYELNGIRCSRCFDV